MILQSKKFWLSHKGRDPKEVYCEFGGFGQTCDANHILAPTKKGTGLITAINQALHAAGVDIEKGGKTNHIDLFNCHATSTPKGDASEAQCIKEILERAPKNQDDQGNANPLRDTIVSANKGNTAHLVCGAATTESIFAIKSIQTGVVPAINNLTPEGSLQNGLNFAFENSSGNRIDTVVKNSLSFGGNNMSAVFKRYKRAGMQSKL